MPLRSQNPKYKGVITLKSQGGWGWGLGDMKKTK